MAEELYFFKLNTIKAKTELINLLKTNENFSYKEYIEKKSYDKLNFQDIISKINESVELLSLDEFWSIFDWFYERVELLENPNFDYKRFSDLLGKTMSEFGLDLFYEIPSKTPVRKFHRILSDYEYQLKNDIMSPLVDYKSKSDEFNAFLKFAICFSGEINLFLNKYYKYAQNDYNLEIQKEIDEIILNDGSKYHAMALNEFMNNQKYYLDAINLVQPLLEFRKNTSNLSSVSYPPKFYEMLEIEWDFVSLSDVFYRFIELKKKMGNYSGIVIRLHSC